ncbi:MAG: HAD family phosphatase [Hespellia sp.]|jgi:HAD superfamily hydrolase (TIGR01509 family)|nr:HAD family phosphatase [Hespellia sp.]
MVNAVIFDMDGVILDTQPLYDSWLKDFLDEYHITIDEETRKRLSGWSYKEYPNIIAGWWRDCGLGDDMTAERMDVLYNDYMQNTNDGHPIPYAKIQDPDIRQVMSELREKGYEIAIASSSPLYSIKQAVHDIGLEPYVNIIVSGEMFERSKPWPDIYLHTADKLNRKPCECVAVEDSTYGIQASKAAGIITIAKRDDRFYFDQNPADFIVDRLSQITKIFCTLPSNML